MLASQTELEARIASLERQLAALRTPRSTQGSQEASSRADLNLDEYRRYGRQMIMPEWGLPGKLRAISYV